jgi:hypothetical protein
MSNDSILDEILNKESASISFEEENNILKPLAREIEMISDSGIQSFVKAILLRADGFWVIPSSFSGKYHPQDEHNEGGNVLHTKRVFRAAKVIADSYSLTEEERNIVYAACLLHDVTKGVLDKDSNSFHYDPMHPYTVGKLVEKCQAQDKKFAGESQSSTLFINQETMQSILRLVRCHLGPWSPVPETVPITYLDMIVHIADNLASKVHYIVDGDDIIEDRWKF